MSEKEMISKEKLIETLLENEEGMTLEEAEAMGEHWDRVK